MKTRLFFIALVLWTGCWVAPNVNAAESQKLNIIYSSFTGAYMPLWIAIDALEMMFDQFPQAEF